MLKIDPTESRRIENFTTFFAPRLTSRYTKKVISENYLFGTPVEAGVPANHPVRSLTTSKLSAALESVEVVDLSNLNSLPADIARLLDPTKKAIVVAAFALGNANNHIKKAVVEAVKQGKIVIIVDRSLLGVVNERYEAGLLGINSRHLAGKSHRLVSGHRLSKATARALAVRAILEGLAQQQAQELVTTYCESRQLLE